MRQKHREHGADSAADKASVARTSSIRLSVGIAASAVASSAFGQINFDWPQHLDERDWGTFVAADDFDFDGLLDLAITKRGVGVEILRNEGDGSFSPYSTVGISTGAGSSLHARDVDFDGDPDLVWETYGNPDVIYLAINDGLGMTWITSQADATEDIWDLEVGNIDRDGDLDVIAATRTGISVFEIEDNELTSERVVYDRSFDDYRPYSVISGDFDLDGDQDIAAVFVDGYCYSNYVDDYCKVSDSQVVFLWNDGSGRFPDVRLVPLPYRNNVRMTPRRIQAGDMDGDHDLDLVLLVGATDYEEPWIPAEYRMIENIDDGSSFVIGDAHSFGHGDAFGLTLADFDTNGTIDIVASTYEEIALYAISNNDDASFDSPVPFPAGVESTRHIIASDVSDDGQPDVVLSGYDGIGIVPNASVVDHLPKVEAPLLVRGASAEIRISGLLPNEPAWLGVTSRGWMPTRGIPEFGGLTFDLAGPLLTTVRLRADADGNAVVRATVPDEIREGLVIFQLGARRGIDGRRSIKSTFETTVAIDQ